MLRLKYFYDKPELPLSQSNSASIHDATMLWEPRRSSTSASNFRLDSAAFSTDLNRLPSSGLLPRASVKEEAAPLAGKNCEEMVQQKLCPVDFRRYLASLVGREMSVLRLRFHYHIGSLEITVSDIFGVWPSLNPGEVHVERPFNSVSASEIRTGPRSSKGGDTAISRGDHMKRDLMLIIRRAECDEDPENSMG